MAVNADGSNTSSNISCLSVFNRFYGKYFWIVPYFVHLSATLKSSGYFVT